MNVEMLPRAEIRFSDTDFTTLKQNNETPSRASRWLSTDSADQNGDWSKADKSTSSKAVSEKAIKDAIKQANKVIGNTDTSLEISIYKPTHEIMVKIKDNKTGQVIREIPSEKMLEMGAYMMKLSGIVVDTKL